ncbi:RHS repeat-associated core domain-containing protein [Endozoicomonas sp. ALB091]|uniref:RHS repeat-associated core domain-containing protein n=1 Tax=Endozoicomonas sp. ALB091 TaxID=3403073 RepID=UPI003BB541C1
MTRLTLPDGSWQSFDYNDARQIIEIRNNWGERINLEPSRVSGEWTAQLVYDSKGNLIRQSERALDSLGRVIKLLGQHGQEVVLAYNKLGNVLTTTEAGKDEKRITRNDYNAISQLTQVIDAMNGSTRFEYGQTGGISEVVAANGAVTRYRYNGFGDTIQVDSPDTGVIVYDYDSAGNKIRAGSGHLRRSIVAENAAEHATGTSIQFEYDLLNRLVAIDYPGTGSDIRYQYDQTDGVHGNGTGQLTSIEDGSGKIEYGYDDFGNTITDRRSFELNDQSYVYTLSYQYGKASKLLGVTYPNGQQLNYRYDANRLKGIETQLAGVQKTLVDKVKHQSFSGVSGWRYGNGLWMDRSFDADGRLSALMLASSSQPKPGQTLWEQVYGYDAFDSIESIQLDDGSERHFKYDALSRLTAELDSRVSDEQFYQYDKAGNRTEHRMGEPGQKPAIWSADYLANSNRLQSYGSTQVLLSGSGSTLVETSAARDRRHIYNRRNQIVATYINFQLTGTYAYNALGQRTHKMIPSTDGPVHTVYHYGLSGQLMAETRIDSQTGKEIHKNYLWLNRVPVAMADDSKGQQITYLHTDHLNTPRKATNDQQTIVWQWNSDAFGMGLANQDPDGDGKETEINLRFAGQYYDHESGLFYNYHRYYDPETGRYSQSDPIGLRGGINTYAYVNSNPLVSTDPLGLFLFAFDGTGNDQMIWVVLMRKQKQMFHSSGGIIKMPIPEMMCFINQV